jgi:hypothetical protein
VAFADTLDDEQIAEFVSRLRKQFAPDSPARTDGRATLARIKAAVSN